MPVRTIVVAVSFEEDGRQIADRAVQLANEHDAQLVAVHVLENLHLHRAELPSSVDPDALAALIEDEAAERLRALFAASRRPVLAKVGTGKPHDVIGELAGAHHADLIVIGPGTARNLREKVFGSTADRVVRCAPCPVLVVRAPVTGPYRHIAVGVDFSDHARAAGAVASRLAPAASREFIHAIEIPLAFEQAMLKAGTSQQEIRRYRNARAATARRQLVGVLAGDGPLSGSPRVRIVQGAPAAALLNASRRRGTDLVALGTQGANAVAQHLLGSVARKLLAGSKCDVLVVPATAV